ncbi:unnamed protein product [Adineta steineri]|uniref:Uncharacterized protein n=1 Tax=Adineta steineri TaxID=433720 RepID=A0A819HQL4_9BILA|nr:unnamed protein product [Adineta steineri]CAF3904826.1 unnamed protein product [Adineta steineri]
MRRNSTTDLFPRINRDDDRDRRQSDVQNPNLSIHQWLHGHQSNIDSTTNSSRRERRPTSLDSTSSNLRQPRTVLPYLPNPRWNGPSRNNDRPPRGITIESMLYRSRQPRAISMSTINPSSAPNSPRPSISIDFHIEQENLPPIISSPLPSPSPNILSKDHYCSLELNCLLPANDKKLINLIRQIIPDGFEQLIPVFIKLQVLIVPDMFLEINKQRLTYKQLSERCRLIILMRRDEHCILYQQYVQRLYGNGQLDNNSTLSYEGQLSLLETYKDQIEYELNKRIKHWNSIPMISSTTKTNTPDHVSLSDRLSSNQKSSKNNHLIRLNTDDDLLNISTSDNLDYQWKQKSVVFVIEKGMDLFRKVTSLSFSVLTNIHSNEQHTTHESYKQNLVKEFKQWLYLWSTLYTNDNHIN